MEKRKKAATKLTEFMIKDKRVPPFDLKINGEKVPLYYCAEFFHFEKGYNVEDLQSFIHVSTKTKMKKMNSLIN